MLTKFTDRWIAQKEEIIQMWRAKLPDSYDDIMKTVLMRISDEDNYNAPDPRRLTIIDHGDYQGTKLFVIGATGYQPSSYYLVFVYYGSCSECDTFEATVSGWGSDDPLVLASKAEAAWTLGLHMLQNMKHYNQDGEVKSA